MHRYGIVITLCLLAACRAEQGAPGETAGAAGSFCDELPRPQNAALPLSAASDDWFRVYESAPGVYSIVEPYQFQETISHLIVGEQRAVLFDTGLGLVPIRPVIERLTKLPVTVLNSHTHYDHVGGNQEFFEVLAIDTDYTRANMAGFGHARIAEDLVAEAFCQGPPPGVHLSSFHTPAWQASRFVEDGETLELGGRRLEVLHVPGHTPDAIALLDEEHRLLFTGDTYYDAELWLFVPETSLDDYARSIARLARLEDEIDYLLGAHNVARVDAGRLAEVSAAFQKLRRGEVSGVNTAGDRLLFEIDGIAFVTARPVLDGRQGDISRGGSGLDTWP